MEQLFGILKIRNIHRKYGGATFLTPCLGVKHVVETPFPAIPLGFFFLGNMGTVSDEHVARFRQDISRMEKRYSGKWSPNILADQC
jgi:hypothetical protein